MDIESLPETCIQADFSQGSDIFSDKSRGKQCMANCFIFFCPLILNIVCVT